MLYFWIICQNDVLGVCSKHGCLWWIAGRNLICYLMSPYNLFTGFLLIFLDFSHYLHRSSHHVTVQKMSYCKRSIILTRDSEYKTRFKREEPGLLMYSDMWIMFAPSLPSSSAEWKGLVCPLSHLFVTEITVVFIGLSWVHGYYSKWIFTLVAMPFLTGLKREVFSVQSSALF